MRDHRAWIRQAMARTTLCGLLAVLAVLALARPSWVAAALGRTGDGPPVSWVILGAAWGTVVAGTGALLAWARVREADDDGPAPCRS